MNPTKDRGTGCTGSSIGNRITAKRAGQLSGMRLPQVVELCRQRKIFGIRFDDLWWVSPMIVPKLQTLVLPKPSRPFGVPEIFARGGLL